VIAFRSVGSQLENGDIDSVRSFFTSEELGNWKDFSTAGYLLANAFRRSSNTPPDNLPSVKVSTENTTFLLNLMKSCSKITAHSKFPPFRNGKPLQVKLKLSPNP
jgi:hypothetical protein